MKQYVGSVVGSHDRSLIATTGPRGGLVLIWDTVKLKLISKRSIPDVCGAAPFDHGFFLAMDVAIYGVRIQKFLNIIMWDGIII